MTASVTVTVPSAAAAAGPRPTAASEPRDGAGATNDFDSRLQAARQQQVASGADEAPGERSDRQRMAATPPSPESQPDAARPTDPGTLPAPPPITSAAVQVVMPAAAQAAAPAAESAAPADRDEPDDPPASDEAVAMLALLGSSVAAALQPVAGNAGAATGAAGAAARAAGQAGKAAAIDAGTAAMLQLDSAGSPPATPVAMPPQTASLPATADAALPALAVADKDVSEGRGLAMALPAPSTAAAAPAAVHQLQLPSPPGSPSFAQDLGRQVIWLGSQNLKEARIRLRPEELGSLDVSVRVAHGRVDVVFTAQHPAAIPAVQQSLPQLGQMLAQHGLSLGHAEVGQHDRGDRRGQAGHADTAAVDEIADSHGGLPMTLRKIGLLDAFA